MQSQLIFIAVVQGLRNSVVTRSNLGVVHCNYCLNFFPQNPGYSCVTRIWVLGYAGQHL